MPEEKQFMRPEQATLKAGNHESRVSRCSVCARRRPDVRVGQLVGRGGSPDRSGPGPNEIPNYDLPGFKEVAWG